MNRIKTETIHYGAFGRCLRLSNGLCEAVITLDFGPRIIRFGFAGKENFLFEDPTLKIGNSDEVIEAVFGEGCAWRNYGGHRLWMSPEDMPLTYYPDNEPVEYREIAGGAEITPPAQRITDVQYRFKITLDEERPKLHLKQYITNTGTANRRNAAWGITVMGKGGLEIIPQPTNDTGLLPNRAIALWPYSDMSDERVYFGKKYITLRQDAEIESAFKVGITNLRGWAAYVNNGGMFIKKFPVNPAGKYPDFDISYESYTNNHILEMESLGELVDITPGSTVCHSEEWLLVDKVEKPDPKDEITIDTLVKLYIEK